MKERISVTLGSRLAGLRQMKFSARFMSYYDWAVRHSISLRSGFIASKPPPPSSCRKNPSWTPVIHDIPHLVPVKPLYPRISFILSIHLLRCLLTLLTSLHLSNLIFSTNSNTLHSRIFMYPYYLIVPFFKTSSTFLGTPTSFLLFFSFYHFLLQSLL